MRSFVRASFQLAIVIILLPHGVPVVALSESPFEFVSVSNLSGSRALSHQITNDGHILVAGIQGGNSSEQVFLKRYHMNGSFDSEQIIISTQKTWIGSLDIIPRNESDPVVIISAFDSSNQS